MHGELSSVLGLNDRERRSPMLGSKCLSTRLPRLGLDAAPHESRGAFTLIEILIVISIISLLASLVMVGVLQSRPPALIAATQTQVASLALAVEHYALDEADYPGNALEHDPERNDFPILYKALFGERRPRGPGGRSAPYASLKAEDLAVWEPDQQAYRKALRRELQDDRIPKFLLDPWGQPYVYRAARESRLKGCGPGFELYSLGPNGIDDLAAGSEDPDDIGNW
jgi:general secretion pathway protein G